MIKSPITLFIEMVAVRKKEGWTQDEFYNNYNCSSFMSIEDFNKIWDDVDV